MAQNEDAHYTDMQEVWGQIPQEAFDLACKQNPNHPYLKFAETLADEYDRLGGPNIAKKIRGGALTVFGIMTNPSPTPDGIGTALDFLNLLDADAHDGIRASQTAAGQSLRDLGKTTQIWFTEAVAAYHPGERFDSE